MKPIKHKIDNYKHMQKIRLKMVQQSNVRQKINLPVLHNFAK